MSFDIRGVAPKPESVSHYRERRVPVSAVAILNTGFVCSVGLSAPASCAAIRAHVRNPRESRFLAQSGDWIVAHEVELEQPWRGRRRLAKMASLAIDEVLAESSTYATAERIPLLLCLAEHDRPGRIDGIDSGLIAEIQDQLGVVFSSYSETISQGSAGAAVALAHARHLIEQGSADYVLIAATDSLLNWRTLRELDRHKRLLTADNSNGFIPGEGAAAFLVGSPGVEGLICAGIGFSVEPAPIGSYEILRGEGTSRAIMQALHDAECELDSIELRISDVAGEHYYFKDAALAIARAGRMRSEPVDMWHPSECVGQCGAVAGCAAIVVAEAACRVGYAGGTRILVHLAIDGGARAAVVLQCRRPD